MYGKNSKLVPYQQSIQIAPGKHVDLPASRLISEQIDNLRKSGFITTMKVDSSKQIASSDLLSQISKTVKPNKLKILKK
jgi:ribosomal protein S8